MKYGAARLTAPPGNTMSITEAHRVKAQTGTITPSQLIIRPHQGLP